MSNQIRINHYAIKSYEEFLEKRSRGRARFNRERGLDYFDNYDLNDIINDSMMDKYIVELKKRIKWIQNWMKLSNKSNKFSLGKAAF